MVLFSTNVLRKCRMTEPSSLLSSTNVRLLALSVGLLYWYTRTTTHGLSWRAQWLSIACTVVRVFYQLNQTSMEDWISFHTFGKTFSLGCLVASAVLKVATLLRIELERGRITRRPASKKERDTRRLDDKIGWLPAAVVSRGRWSSPSSWH